MGEEGGVSFLVLEYCEGETLADRLSRGRRPPEEVLRFGVQMADGLAAAHRQGVVHRDLKPGNVVIARDGVKVLDFGLAKPFSLGPDSAETELRTEPLTRDGAIVGTLYYMSPEQLQNRDVDARTDIFAFGCVLYEMITGSRPFEAESSAEVIAAILKRRPPPLETLSPSCDPGIALVVDRCLEKEPDQRWQSAADVKLILEGLAAGKFGRRREATGTSRRSDGEPDAHPQVESELSPRADPVQRRPLRLFIPLTLAAIAVAAMAGSLWLPWRPAETPPSGPRAAYAWDVRPLTATGDAWNVALSPDGETVAYLSSQGLVTQDTSGGNSNLVLSDPIWSLGTRARLGRPFGEPRWLHDGSGVAFTVQIDSTTLGISAVPRMGGAVQPQLATNLEGGENSATFQSLDEDTYLLGRTLESKQAAPWIRWIQGGVEEGIELPEDVVDLWDAVASPQSSWVAYIGERADGTTVVATVSRDGSRHNVIVERRGELSKWSELSITRHWAGNRIMRWPPGDRVYYREISTRGLDVYAVTLASESGRGLGEPELIYSGLPPGASFDVASDGKRIAYSGGVIKTQIRVYRFDAGHGGEPIESWPVTRGTARHVAPRVSPAGQRIAYIRKTRASDDIYIAPLAGGPAEPLYVLYQWNQLIDLKWLPKKEDELIAFANTAHGPKLVRISLADSRATEIDTRPVRGTWFAVSPEGERIAYGIRGDEAYVIQELATGKELEFFNELPGEKIQALFSPDGQEILVNNIGQMRAGLWRTRLDGVSPTLLTGEVFGRSFPAAWSRAGTVYVLGEEGTILAVDTSRGSFREFGRIPEAPIWEGWASIHETEDDLYLVCSIDEPRESDVWIMDRIE